MAEVEFGGVKFRGGKIAVILTALSSLGGAMWGGFEFYKDYTDMRNKIQSYVTPDLSNFDKRLDILDTKLKSFEKLERAIQDSADSARDEARTIKRDLKGENARMERLIESIEKRIKGIQDSAREMIDKENNRNRALRDRINSRMDSLDSSVKESLTTLEKDVNEQIRRALENPLSKLK
jgi:DNA anti-recombination protein RmuC